MGRAILILAVVLTMAIIVSWEICFFVDSQNYQDYYHYADNKERAASCAAHILITPLFWIATVIDENEKIIVAMASAAVAVFTCTLWWSTKLLWESSEIHAGYAAQAIQATERSANWQLRAYVHVDKISMLHLNSEWAPNIRITF